MTAADTTRSDCDIATSQAASSSQGRGQQKRRVEDPPDDQGFDGQGQSDVVLDAFDKRYVLSCATVNAALHRAANYIHNSKNRHQRLGSAPSARTSITMSEHQFRAHQFQDESKQLFETKIKLMACDVPVGSVMELSPDADEAGSQPLQHHHAQDPA